MLEGKRAFVCGATQGIGRGIALALAAKKMHVIVSGKNLSYKAPSSISFEMLIVMTPEP